MATEKQKKVAELIIQNASLDKPLNGGEILEKVGYSEGIQEYPAKVINSEGVQQVLEDYGFTEENAKRVVTEIMLDPLKEPNARLKATDQVFKVRGSYAPEKKDITTLGEKLPSTDLDKLAETMAETLKQQKI